MAFDIDPVLRKDCHLLGRFRYAYLLLYRHRSIPWFILVPETSETEVVELPHDDQLELAVLDLDRTALSRDYLASLTNNQDLVLVRTVHRYDEILPALITGEVDAALVIPPGFADTVNGGQPAQVQAVIDG
ncbi:MAG: hypothetical protein P8Y83_11415, partial [Gammaproteobacteria bacterium]